jgi:O-antigen ligase
MLHAWIRRALDIDLLGRVAVFATLALPWVLLYGRTLGEIGIGVVAVGFLADRALRADWAWLRSWWASLSLAYWAWLVLCSVLDGSPHSIAEAVVAVRLFVFAAALEHWVLRKPAARHLLYMVAAVAVWVAAESWQQELFGSNIFGYVRNSTGALTGPFYRPRAGATFQMTFLPGLLPLILALLNRRGLRWQAAGVAALGLGVATSLIIGQRMPLALLLLGLCAVGLALRRYRLPLLACGVCGAAVLLASPYIAPQMYLRLVTRFAALMQHFMESPYGLLLNRAVAMVQAHPWTGFGFDGFRDHCMDMAFRNGSSWLPAADPSYALQQGWLLKDSMNDRVGCSLHPHNYWLQIATQAGLPGVLLFAVLVAGTLRQIWRGAKGPDAVQAVCLFAAVFAIFWPIASSTTLFALPNAGWAFLTIGWGLGVVRRAERESQR